MPDTNHDTKYLVAINNFLKFGPVRVKKLKNYFPNMEDAFKAPLGELIKSGIEAPIAEEFLTARIKIDPDRLYEKLDKENIKVTAPDDKVYPKLLSEIYDPPALLYYKGALNKEDEFSLSVVGTRKLTAYGRQAAEKIVNELSRNNITIISGLALGIDTLAHLGALDASGKTIAVLGTGIDKNSVYPSSNHYLAEKIIASGGAIISEFPLGTPPLRHHFPQRNRIISGLSLGTLVIEAGEKSGALITARFALEQNREVFAVPGSIFSTVSIGPNNLIKQGAHPISAAAEIIEALDLINITSYIDNKKIMPETKEEELIAENLTHEPIHVDEIIRLTGLDTSKINSTLTIMEMKGMVRNLGNMSYVIAR